MCQFGADHRRSIEDAFSYRLVWALEALRMRRLALGGKPEIIAGGAAACVEKRGLSSYVRSYLTEAKLRSPQPPAEIERPE